MFKTGISKKKNTYKFLKEDNKNYQFYFTTRNPKEIIELKLALYIKSIEFGP